MVPLLLLLACAARAPLSSEVPVAVTAHLDVVDPAAGVQDPDLRALVGDHWAGLMDRWPVWATRTGDRRHDDRLADRSPQAVAAGRAERDALLERARALPVDGLSAEDRLTHALFVHMLETDQATDACRAETWAVSARSNLVQELSTLPRSHAIRDAADAESLLSRVRAIPARVDQELALLREGLAAGRVADAESLRRAVVMVEGELARPLADWPLLDPLDGALPPDLPPGWSEALVAEVDGPVRAAFARYRDLLRDELLPAARGDDRPGMLTMPGGRACYAAAIAEHAGLPLSAVEIHAIGLAELARIHGELQQLGEQALGTAELPEILARLRDDPALRFESGEEIVAEAEAALAAAQQAVPAAFGRLPATPCEVQVIPDQQAPWTYVAYYDPPTPGGLKPGQYYVNTWAPTTRLRHEARALAFHESVPGHHLQIALSQELSETPAFRRLLGLTVFVEGWALYAEVLAGELGLYRDDLDRLGALSFDAWRASRLVVDTGIHHLGWSRQQAIDFMLENTPLAPNNIDNEVDRYIGWPGQALGYKLGQLELLRLREQARQALGPDFDLAAFHDVVLGAGPVPMAVLNARVHAWIGEQLEP